MLENKISKYNASIDLLNTNNLDAGTLSDYGDYSNFSLKGFNLLKPFAKRGYINIKNIDWTKKEVSYELVLQGKNMGTEKASFGKDSILSYESKNKDFTFSVNNAVKDNDSVMILTLYKGLLKGVNTSKYESLTLDGKMIFFNKRTVLENYIKKGENILETLSEDNEDSKDKGSVVDAQAINKVYKNSGSKLSFKDWANSKEGKDSMNKLTDTYKEVNKGVAQVDTVKSKDIPKANVKKDSEKEGTTILGMSPVTFGIVAVGSLIFASVVSIYLLKQGSKKGV